MEKHFVTYKQALALKEIGFDAPCLYSYYQDGTIASELKSINWNLSDTLCSAPIKSQVFEWARKTHNISHSMKPIIGSKNGYDSYPILGWDSDLFILTKGATNSYYMGYPVGEWFTATLDCFDDGDTLEDRIDIRTYDEAESYCIDKLIQTIKKDLLWRSTL
jgi:hypothetical protein